MITHCWHCPNVLWMLYLGRIISGITGATGVVAASVNGGQHGGQRAYRLGSAVSVRPLVPG
ncbi:hypothetical protein WHW08_28340 [Klebsiella pneumoniae]